MESKQILYLVILSIVILTGVSVFIFSNVGQSVLNGAEIKNPNLSINIYETERTLGSVPQTFVSTKNSWIQGEDILLQNFQDVYEACGNIGILFSIREDSTGALWINNGEDFGAVAFTTLGYQIIVDGANTRTFKTGSYTTEVSWLCDGKSLGIDGSFDNPSTTPDIFKFNIRSNVEEVERPSSCVIKTCPAGEKLINPNSASCICQAQWTANNGICEIGENSVNSPKDCKEDVGVADCESEGLLLLDGVCINPNYVCEDKGGNRDCVTPATGFFAPIKNFFNNIGKFFGDGVGGVKNFFSNAFSSIGGFLMLILYLIGAIIIIAIIIAVIIAIRSLTR